jgi:hypothetical protein
MTALDVSSDPIQAIFSGAACLASTTLAPARISPAEIIIRPTDLADLQRMQGGLM